MGLMGRWERSEHQFPEKNLGLSQLLGTPEGNERHSEMNGANTDGTLPLTLQREPLFCTPET